MRHVPVAEIMPGTTIDLEDNDYVMSAILIALVAPINDDAGGPRVHLVNTPGTSWIVARGLLSAALDIERGVGRIIEEDDQ